MHGSGHARRGRLSGRCQGGCIGQPRQPVSGAGQGAQTFRGQQRHALVRTVFVQDGFQIIRQGTLLLFQCGQQLFFRAVQHFLRQPCTLRRWPDGQPGPAGMSGAGGRIRGCGGCGQWVVLRHHDVNGKVSPWSRCPIVRVLPTPR